MMGRKELALGLRGLGYLFAVMGVVITIVMIISFSQGGVYHPAELKLWEVAVSVLVGFYNLVVSSLLMSCCLLISDSGERMKVVVRKILHCFGWILIALGVVFFVGLAVYYWNRDMALIRAFLGFIYNFAFGLLSLGLCASMRRGKNQSV